MKKIFIQGAAAGIITIGLSKIFSFLLKILIARLGSDTFGLYTTAITTFTSIVTLLAFGVPMSTARFVSLYTGSGHEKKLQNVLSSSLTILLLNGTIGTFAIFIWKKFFPLPDLSVLTLAIIPALFIVGIKQIYFGLLSAPVAYALENIESPIRLVAIFFLLFFVSTSTLSLFTGYTLAIFLTAAVGAFMFIRSHPAFKPNLTWSKSLVSYAWPVGGSEIVTSVTTAGTMIYFAGISGAQDVGLYASALSLASLIHLLPQVIMPIFFPAITTQYGMNLPIRALYTKIIKLLVFTLIPLTGGLIFAGQSLLWMLFGSEYTASYPILIVLSIACTLYAVIVWPNRQILDMMGKTRMYLLITLIRSGIIILLSLVLIPSHSGKGLSIAVMAGWAAEGILCLFILNQIMSAEKSAIARSSV